MNKGVGVLIFTIGAAIGSAATWYFTKKRYEQISKDEIESVKESFSKKKEPVTYIVNTINDNSAIEEQKEKADMAREKPSVAEYAKKLSSEGYTDYSKSDIFVDDEEEDKDDGDPGPDPEPMFGDPSAKPYVITPEEFGEFDDYDRISFTYYADHVIADDNDQLLEDVENVIGFESLTHFGEYDDDAVYVRNERLKTDYEILRDERTYSDVLQSKPYLREV